MGLLSEITLDSEVRSAPEARWLAMGVPSFSMAAAQSPIARIDPLK
jgi:hypothetical protein